jgi:hypothetical protein
MVFFRAARSDAKSDVRKGKALPARRFECVRRHSQKRLRTPPSLRGLDRIETVIQDETGKKGGIEIDARPVREPVISLRQFKDEACGVLTRHSSKKLRGGWQVFKRRVGNRPSGAMRSKPPGMNAGARRAFWSQDPVASNKRPAAHATVEAKEFAAQQHIGSVRCESRVLPGARLAALRFCREGSHAAITTAFMTRARSCFAHPLGAFRRA